MGIARRKTLPPDHHKTTRTPFWGKGKPLVNQQKSFALPSPTFLRKKTIIEYPSFVLKIKKQKEKLRGEGGNMSKMSENKEEKSPTQGEVWRRKGRECLKQN
ncbi:hypothetical protein Gferi_26530 [Geosporobacter ferrireducens]|uniref:Uncharacterized protein n=1 Tax=Geosporobacter ferrireducens TaxID=1424294 RepID=A0A1D8GPC6_9FIRM|nr:hypothetical protein Gferi_26530 [Geosporobacter ferrireducens]